ncbi:MAG: hypothetical protein NC453_26005 [Muribaculum sp.]|nr:hypothetical protein [Muribaculum sp.]
MSIVGESGVGALIYDPITTEGKEEFVGEFDLLQEKALEVLKEQKDPDAGLLLYNIGNSGGARPKAIWFVHDTF